MWPLISLLALPVAELVAMIELAQVIGTLPVLGLLFLAGVAGFALVRRGGIHSMTEIQGAMRNMGNPEGTAMRGGFWIVAGVLLIVPGFLTDIAALLLLLRPVQRAVIRRMRVSGMVSGSFSGERRSTQAQHGPVIIDAEFHEIETKAPRVDGTSGWTRH